MINVNTLQPQPNYATLSSLEVQSALPELEGLKQAYAAVLETAPRILSSYLPNHHPTEAPAPHYAAIKGSVEQLEALGDFVDLVTANKGLTPLHYALVFQQEEAIRFLIEKCDLTRLTPDENSYLHYAALTGDPDIVRLFLDRGVDPGLRNKDSLTAAHLWAFSSNDLTGLQTLAPPPEQPETYYFTPLQLMALNAAHADSAELSEAEWTLFTTHLADLGVVGLSQLCESYRISNIGTSCLEFLHTIMQAAKADPIHKLAPSKLKDATDPDMVRNLHIQQWMPLPAQMRYFFRMPPYAMGLQSGLSASAVAWNTLSKLPNLMQLSWKTALTTVVVRFGNMLLSARDTWLAVDYPRYEGEHCYADAMRLVGDMSDEEIKHLPDLAKECQEKFQKLQMRGFPVEARSEEINKIFRHASLVVHPDKCPGGTEAQTHLNILSDLIPKL